MRFSEFSLNLRDLHWFKFRVDLHSQDVCAWFENKINHCYTTWKPQRYKIIFLSGIGPFVQKAPSWITWNWDGIKRVKWTANQKRKGIAQVVLESPYGLQDQDRLISGTVMAVTLLGYICVCFLCPYLCHRGSIRTKIGRVDKKKANATLSSRSHRYPITSSKFYIIRQGGW